MPAWFLADVIVAVHFAYVSIVVFTVPAVAIGWVRDWKWIRSSWFRHVHLAMIGIVVIEALAGWNCPLTVWEKELRSAAGQESFDGSFIGYWLHELLFYDFEPWVFTAAYTVFGLLVLLLYIFVPPRRAIHLPHRRVITAPGA